MITQETTLRKEIPAMRKKGRTKLTPSGRNGKQEMRKHKLGRKQD